ncbi:isoleucine--tRNA ligase, mitochondrial-like [Lineus longissimus]|uniref:isoleucine--tRNA ligase, mitochondrial-like n=1 Tax=Lineus longissimus TaxID=88925 RepID=UPI002B4CEF7D
MLFRQYLIAEKVSWSCHAYFRRAFCKLRKKSSSKYSDTLNLPKTTFPLTMKNGVAAVRELELQQVCGFSELYAWQRKQKREEYILHDGPPYANGNPHVGHAINKILKDITNRYKVLKGYKVHYVPGWDCHGLPIELKAMEKYKASVNSGSSAPQEIRKKARQFAKDAILIQSNAFKRWGVMADWANTCYFTYDKEYEAKQLQLFYALFKKGYVYQDYMPVYWSPSTRTALAEAELEYNPDYISKAIYLKFPISRLPPALQTNMIPAKGIYALVWTTTPWTIPANQAICYNNSIRYCVGKCLESGELFLFAADCHQNISQTLGKRLEIISEVPSDALQGSKYTHPLSPERELPFLPGHHVTTTKGTGLVHTAPAHGHDDFKIALQNGLSLDCTVNEDGVFNESAGPEFSGKEVLGDGNSHAIELLRQHICHIEDFTHRYPIDWRSKKPVIIRASRQWFINTERIKEKALECFDAVNVYPKSMGQGMVSLLNSRPYWCISRQRVWGVPIPVFCQQDTGKTILNSHTVGHLVELVKQHGTDCWWDLPMEELLPTEVLQKSGLDINGSYVKGGDIFDIWFDSGSSWMCAFPEKPPVADLYLEGTDQFRGWFQSSLLLNVALHGQAPYKNLLVHGFAVDEEGKKMSKSIGNVVDPQVVIDGGKDKKKDPSYGADVLRWWAARYHTENSIEIGPTVLEQSNETIYKLRKVLRFLLGNLNDFNLDEHEVGMGDLLPQDQYMLHQLHGFVTKVTDSYDEFDYHRVLVMLEKFVNMEVAAYIVIAKDRLYCDCADSLTRRSGQMVLHHLLDILTKTCAPILPHLAEEIHLHRCGDMSDDDALGENSIFKEAWSEPDPDWFNPDIDDTFKSLLKIRDLFYKKIMSSEVVMFDVAISSSGRLSQLLKTLQPDRISGNSPLTELLQCSQVTILDGPPQSVILEKARVAHGEIEIATEEKDTTTEAFTLTIIPSPNYRCERCRRTLATKPGQPCQRCMDVLEMG